MVKQKIPTIVDLFDISDYEHKELFDGIEYPWDVLKPRKQRLAGSKA